MPSKSKLQNGRSSSPSERRPLLGSRLITPVAPPPVPGVDGLSGQTTPKQSTGYSTPTNGPARGQDGHTAASQTITPIRGALCAIGLGFLIFLQATNISLLTTTQSEIASELDAFEKTSWFTSTYLIAMSSLSPLNGKLALVFGPRVTIFASTIILAVGSVCSGSAGSFETFIAGRAITGIGASGIFTISIIIVLELSGSKRRGLAIGLLNSGYTFGVAIGAVAAGALLPHTGWRPIFWLQAPIALVAGIFILFAVPHDFHAGKKFTADEEDGLMTRLMRIDYFGALTLTASIVLLLYSLSSPNQIPLLPIVLSFIVLITFILNEVYLASDPIIPVSLLRSRGLLLTCLATVGYMMSRWTVLFYAPIYTIAVRQWAPVSAGSILIPTNGGFAVGGLLVGWLHIKRQGAFYIPTLVVYTIYPLTLVSLAFLSTEHSNTWLYVIAVFLCGAVTGAALNYNLAHLLHLTPRSTHYVATSLLATFRGFAGSFGSSIGGGLFTRTLYTSLQTNFDQKGLYHREDLVRRLLGSPALVRSLDGVDREVAIEGYQDALKALFLGGAALAVCMIFVQAGTGWKGAEEDETLDESESAQEEGLIEQENEQQGL